LRITFARYRTSIVAPAVGVDLVFRIINTKSAATMDSSVCRSISNLLTRYQNGLILVTGSVAAENRHARGFGRQVNIERREHSSTLKIPIEYGWNRRAPHHPTRSAHAHPLVRGGVRGALREDPDVIMVG